MKTAMVKRECLVCKARYGLKFAQIVNYIDAFMYRYRRFLHEVTSNCLILQMNVR
jgi:hypothetical protein